MTDEGRDASCQDGLLRSQWCDQFAPDFFDLPERRLLLAVLVDALRILRTGDLKEQNGVLTWIHGHEARFTFQDVCDGLDLDAQRVAVQMVEHHAATPVPRRARPGRKGQSCGRRPQRGQGVLVTRDPTPGPIAEDPGGSRSRVAVASASPPVVGQIDLGLLAAAM